MTDLDPVTEVLASRPAVRLAVAFGSVARGGDHPRSDLDLGLLLDPDTLESRREVEIATGRAARRRVDCVYLEEAPPLLRFEIARGGKVLLERSPGLCRPHNTGRARRRLRRLPPPAVRERLQLRPEEVRSRPRRSRRSRRRARPGS
ncbi:MAG: nucleotidyltransferase domain-containing protein [bacterium]|nr:nucleotidyltransferase domain-containing protein [bacterium]